MIAKAERAIQGNADGLCGIYAIINFLVRYGEIVGDPKSDSTAGQESFRYVLEAAERINLLSAYKLYSGFEWPDLIAVFNEYARYNHFDFLAVPLRKIHLGLPSVTNDNLWGAIIDAGGAAIAAVDGGGHWVLVHGRSEPNGFAVIDPAPSSNPQTSLKRAWSLEDGVALLPKGSELLEKNNA